MADWIIKAFLLAFATWVIWSILLPRYEFEIRVQGGEARIR